jgi:hypothetical protein
VRTTLTLDEEVAVKLREHMAETGKSFKDSVNDLLRLAIHTARKKVEPPFVVLPFKTAPLPGLNLDNVEELLDQVEGPDRKW